jgi:integrase
MNDGKNWHKIGTKLPSPKGSETGPEAAKRGGSKFAKSDPRYWLSRVKHRVVNDWTATSYSVRMHRHGKRVLVTLNSTTKRDAANEALELWLQIRSNGWEFAETYRKRNKVPVPAAKNVEPSTTISHQSPVKVFTVGMLLECFTATMVDIRATTRNAYFVAVRSIVADILTDSGGTLKKEGRAELLNNTPLEMLNREALRKWLSAKLAAGDDESKRTLRSRIINAKSIFNTHVLERFNEDHRTTIENPFTGLMIPKGGTKRHYRKVSLKEVLKQAKALKASGSADDLECWKIIILASSGGLRRSEIDNLRWADIDFNNRRIHVRPSETYALKTKASEAVIPIEVEVANEIASWKRGKPGEFVIAAKKDSRQAMRSGGHQAATAAWLRECTIGGEQPLKDVQKPLHELRKEAGSLVNETHGIQEARVFLRHTDITTTANYYLDSSSKVTAGIGAALDQRLVATPIHKAAEGTVSLADSASPQSENTSV